MTIMRQPTRAGVRDAAAKIAEILPPSPLMVREINGLAVAFQMEALQPVGAFKLRGAWHRLTALDDESRARGVVAFSSGNHAQGVAWAAKRLGIAATIVMPSDAPQAKLAATLALGAEVVRYDRATESREKIAAHLAHARGAVLVPSFDDAWVIEGQGSAGIEAAAQMAAAGLPAPTRAVVPCGGGGLAAGIALALPDAEVVTVEPEGWDDMRRSLEAGWIEPVGDAPPPTACDALQTMRVAERTFDVLSRRGATGVAVSEGDIGEAQRWAMRHLRTVVEPGGAVALAAILSRRVAVVPGTLVLVSGGNVDAAAYAKVLAA
ncbi:MULTISPECIES: threonine ammonia-lyase [unclassified Sphingomonas]|uniref:threonine ammonia-lyase n=1 Tax=unclassified Sphingomonas TaxID=196159 RepID=UPI0006F90053|nr:MULTISPECIES: pyridoxal-phosphate dependent enzyme [unclassified Sphingomonas]KQM27196.1 pyridoxal-5'-phosphate-dependent protein [Sphingomonas sp. Leaf9]KQM43533.1 pyridoxal-5'-phosphate-dependent protein [Sphingomonas sp. Leaf11]